MSCRLAATAVPTANTSGAADPTAQRSRAAEARRSTALVRIFGWTLGRRRAVDLRSSDDRRDRWRSEGLFEAVHRSHQSDWRLL